MIRPKTRILANRIGLLGILAATVLPFCAHAENVFETWINRYEPNLGNSPGANAIAIDKSGNIAVAGYTRSGNDRIYYVAKHDPFDGAVRAPWPRTFDSLEGTNEANAVAFDSAGGIIVTGESQTTADGLDYFTRKYNADGGIEWSVRYDENSGSDRALFIAVDSADNVIVTGRSVNGGVSGEDIYTVKYNGQTGAIMSSFRFTSAATRTDYPTGLVIDSADKVIVCGVTTDATSTDFYLAKYDMSTLAATADWTRIFGTTSDDEAHAVAVDAADNVVVTGLVRNGSIHRFFTRKYSSAGVLDWDQNYEQLPGDTEGGARSVAVDAAGNVFVTGTAEVGDNFNTTFYTAKSSAETGTIEWFARTPLFENESVDDTAVKVRVDPSGNPIVAGSARIVGEGNDFYVAKYSSLNNGELIWEKRFKGAFPNDGSDTLSDMAVDSFGNVAIAGDALREAGTLNEIVTIKYGTTALATGDSIAGNGIPENARISAISTPAAASSGAVSARVTISAGKKKVGAIVAVGGGEGLAIPAVQKTAAPGIAGAEFKSFLDPVMAPNGRLAFIGRVSGVPKSKSTGVWTNAFNPAGTLELALQQGEQVPGMAPGTMLQSVSSISLVNNQLLALIRVSGKEADVTKANSTVLYGLTDIGAGTALLRTGDPFTVGGDTTIKSLTVFVPPKGSAGHGRYHSASRAIARATLADKRSAIISVNTAGTDTVLSFTGGDAGSVAAGATWKSLNLPAIASGLVPHAAVSGFLTVGEGGVTKADDAVIAYSFNSGAFTDVAREGSGAPGIGGANFATFLDPLVNSGGNVAFIGTAKGQGVSSKNKTGIWFGAPAGVSLVARTNHPDFAATDGAGVAIDASWSSFTSLALPGGTNAGPLFLARISGRDASKKTNFGLWGVDSSGFVRKIIRNGDQLGDLSVKKFSVLQSSSGSVGSTRSFSSGRTVAVLVNFSNKSTGVVNIGIP